MDKIFMSGSLVPYVLFLFLIWRIRKHDPRLINKFTFIGFCSMLGFITVTAVAGAIALKVINAPTLAHVDYLHGIAEGALTIVNGLIVFGLKKQKDALDSTERDVLEEASVTSYAADA
ncbi:MAG: DUF3593 domain-containing protein [Chloroflexi bacterium]|uniref:DUF3593 domain-containing protein n=1 Tax=Candidatus Chlorohelix allophototropha TaxID=3003348 RepID=A0A8T7M0Z8_9CHLR|nr:DUF3593 domain-containing protein [Chloroflexota bacterium]WJW67493.1 DUF3593 domain-containing protein [Chloroflexota bacterium L227-S17]